ncbi:MAG: methionyl-tRNA formyltransferase [Verrucomicrobia bacterium]|nr:MAG: methionyl-tRNA formyltransferase [Verrucomicrobiota bacterium]
MRVIFMGTPELACVCLRALVAQPELQIVAVVTQPDRPSGRDLKLRASPVKEFAVASSLPVLQPERARQPEFIAELTRLQPDLIAVAAFGRILPKAILDLPRFGCLNVHTSILPKYRGAAPIQWAMLNDEAETGVTIMQMDVGLDTGPILTQEKTPILPEDTAESLHDRLAGMGAELLVKTIPVYVDGKAAPMPQPSKGVSYAPRIKKEDGRIDWKQPARTIWNRVRGLRPWPGAYAYLSPIRRREPGPGGPAGAPREMLKIWEAEVVGEKSGAPGEVLEAGRQGLVVACGKDALRVLTLQREGGKRLAAAQFLAGHSVKAGERLE